MKTIAMLIPSTTRNRDWNKLEDTYLYKFRKLYTQYNIVYYIGYDKDDKIYSKKEERDKFDANWIECNFEKGNVVAVWNHLFEITHSKYDYYYIVGDDIRYPNKPIDIFQKLCTSLDNNNGLGISGVFNGNPNLPMTQFLITDIHYELFKFVFPDKLKNWFCDNFLLELYKEHTFFHPISAPNSGGEPRYNPNNDDGALATYLANQYRRHIHLYQSNNNIFKKGWVVMKNGKQVEYKTYKEATTK